MKHILTSLFVIASVSLFAQKVTVQENVENIGGSGHSSLVTYVYETPVKDVEKAWKDYVKKYKGKTSSSKDELFTDNATIDELSANTIDIYAKIVEQSDAVKIIVAFDLGGIFLSSSAKANEFSRAKDMIRDFAFNTSISAVEEKLKDQEKEQERLEKALEKLKKDKDKLHSSIDDYKNAIIKAEQDIEQNIIDQEGTAKQIENQKAVVEAVKEKLNAIK